MAVYERAYRGYSGPVTSERWRFLVLPRYTLGRVFRSRVFAAFFAACYLGPVVYATLIYLRHNASALKLLEIPPSFLAVDSGFFLKFLALQGFLAFVIALVVGPALVSPDFRNNALPLYLSRPFSRTDYVLGRLSVLVILMSAITWVPGLLLVLLQSSLEPGWLQGNARIALALFVGSWIWILLLSLLALAVSATVKVKPVASAALVVLFIVTAAMGNAFNFTLGTRWGSLIDLGAMNNRVWSSLFGVPSVVDVPVGVAWMVLLLVCGASLALLARRIRAYEVVR